MRVLGLDTATTATTAALLDTARGAGREARDDPPAGSRPRHTQRVLGLAAEVLHDAHLDWRELDLIAVGVGPGSFTGLRVGVATARALAQAHGIPVAGVGTLESLALAAASTPRDRPVVAMVDARRREVFAAAWLIPATSGATASGAPPAPEPDPGAWETLIEPLALPPAALADRLGDLDRPLAVGDGALLWRQALERAGAEVPEDGSPLHRVSAAVHCRLAAQAAQAAQGAHAARGADAARQAPAAADGVLPRYLRPPDAQPALPSSR